MIVECSDCKHWVWAADMPTCRAFLGGIPMEILAGEFDHRQPHKGDNGIRFEPIEK